ncbi:MAG: hypothetical protein ACFCU5_13215, partial [Pleurocapsa sp.]
TNRTEYIATNELTCDWINQARKHCSYRWKIEEFHRELKQNSLSFYLTKELEHPSLPMKLV